MRYKLKKKSFEGLGWSFLSPRERQMPEKCRSIFWFRRDLRLSDNRALFEATNSEGEVFPIFIFDIQILGKLKSKKDRRVQFIFEGVLELKKSLREKGSDLLLLTGDPKILVPKIAAKLDAQKVYCNEDYEPYAKVRDSAIKKILAKKHIDLHTFKDHVIFSGQEIQKKDGKPYKVFTPYKKLWLKKVHTQHLKKYNFRVKSLAATRCFPRTKVQKLTQIGFKKVETLFSGEKCALQKFKSFKNKIQNYDRNRDMICLGATSSLSPYIRFGMISTRELVRQALSYRTKGAKTWLSEIIWREFYQMTLDRYPYVVKTAFNEKYGKIRWPGSQNTFKKWTHGKTGYPLIDAAMIHFANSGIMHNRLRMIVASFLVKDLLVDWRKGERYFAQHLLDYDLAANNGGWQWCASTGCDAQPYFRIFNPVTQSIKFDPEGEFIKRHLPILAKYSSREIHFPVNCSKSRQEEAGCIIGKDYPLPIVDHNLQRIKAMRLFKNIRG